MKAMKMREKMDDKDGADEDEDEEGTRGNEDATDQRALYICQVTLVTFTGNFFIAF
jgi:hypothetical protein